MLWYNSANRDEAVFSDPYRFDVTREPNEHVGFGGPGAHHCLGANLARREITVVFRELLTRLPDLEITGAPEMLRSNFIHGIKRMPCAFTPGAERTRQMGDLRLDRHRGLRGVRADLARADPEARRCFPAATAHERTVCAYPLRGAPAAAVAYDADGHSLDFMNNFTR